MNPTSTDAAKADRAIERLHELVSLAHDAVQDVYNQTPESDQRFVEIDDQLGSIEAQIRELRGDVYVADSRVPALRAAVRNV